MAGEAKHKKLGASALDDFRFSYMYLKWLKKKQANKKDLKTSIKYLNYEDSFFSFIFSHQLMFIYMSTTSNNGRFFCRVFSHFCPRNIL